MKLLAISTSNRAASAAIIEDGAALLERVSDAGLTHSETIMPMIDLLMTDAGLTVRDIDGFASDIGPGSFTGVRIGVSIANALAYSTGKKIVAISSLKALASVHFSRAARSQQSVCALIDARNGNGYAALYKDGVALIPPSPVKVEELLSSVPEGTFFTGDGSIVYRDMIASRVSGASFAAERETVLTASMLALPASREFHLGNIADEVTPLYLRPTQAERMYGANKEKSKGGEAK